MVAALVAVAFFMEMLDGAIINTSLPSIAASFHAQPLDLSIGITVYLLSSAVFVPMGGWLADRYGSRTIFLWAIGVFTVASLGCGLVGTLLQFTVMRGVQGLAGALMTPVGRMLVLRNTEKTELLRVTALITWPALLAPVVAPVLGGWITTYASWRWNFFLNVPLGLVGLILSRVFIPQHKSEDVRPLDWLGLVLTSSSLLLMLYGLDSVARGAEKWIAPLACFAVGVVLATFAILHLRRSRVPLIDLRAFHTQTFRISTVSAGAAYRIAINATPFLLPLMFQVGFGLSALQSGSLVLVYFLGNIAIKPLTTPTLRRFGFRTVLVVNGALGGLLLMACATFAADSPHAWIAGVAFLAGVARSMQFTALNTLAFADVTPPQRSAAATLSSIVQQLIAVLGVTYGAMLLNASQWMTRAGTVTGADFRTAFLGVGLLAILSALGFLKLPHSAGIEVSGHKNKA